MFRKLLLFFLVLALAALALIPAAAQEDIVFGVVLVGPNDDRGWSTSHHEAGEYVVANLPGAQMLEFESLNPADAPETTLMDVVELMVDEGASVIFTTSDSFEEDTNVVAAAFPDVTFINITGSNAIQANDIIAGDHAVMHELPPLPPANVGNFNGLMELPRMIAGCAAALTSETGKLGYLGAYGNVNGCSEAPAACIGAAYYNWGPAYLDVMQRVMAGTWEQEWLWLEPKWDEINADGYYTDSDASVIGFKLGDALSMATIESLNAFAAEIEAFQTDPMNAGKIFLWEGPLNLQDGAQLAAAGESVSLLDIWFIPQLLEGMTGASE